MREVDALNQLAQKWLAEIYPELHLIRATLDYDKIVCSVLSHYDGVKRGKRHPAITIPNIRWAV